MLVLIKEMFIGLLISIDDASNHTKCVSLSNQKFEIQPTFINLHPKKYSQEFHYYPFTVKLAKCVESNTLNDLSNKVCDPNKTEDVNLNIFNMTTGTDESETLKKHISCECKCRFDGRNCNSDQWWNNDKCQCERKKHHLCKRYYVWNLAMCNCQNGKYLASIMDVSAIMWDEIIDSYAKLSLKEDEEEKNFNEKKQPAKRKISIFYLHFH